MLLTSQYHLVLYGCQFDLLLQTLAWMKNSGPLPSNRQLLYTTFFATVEAMYPMNLYMKNRLIIAPFTQSFHCVTIYFQSVREKANCLLEHCHPFTSDQIQIDMVILSMYPVCRELPQPTMLCSTNASRGLNCTAGE